MISFIKKSKKVGIIKLSRNGKTIRYGSTIINFIFKPKYETIQLFLLNNLVIRTQISLNEDLNTFVQDVFSIYLLQKHNLSLKNIPVKSFTYAFINNGLTKESIISEFGNRLNKYINNRNKSMLIIRRRFKIIEMKPSNYYIPKSTNILRVIFKDASSLRAPPKRLIFQTLRKIA